MASSPLAAGSSAAGSSAAGSSAAGAAVSDDESSSDPHDVPINTNGTNKHNATLDLTVLSLDQLLIATAILKDCAGL
jgi:hypothetical protein